MGAKEKGQQFKNQYRVLDNDKIINFGKYVEEQKEQRNRAIKEISKSIQAEKILTRGRKRRVRNRKKSIKHNERLKNNRERSNTGKKYKGNIKTKIAAWTLSLGIAVGGIAVANNVYENYQKQNEPATLEQVLDEGVNLEKLGINNKLVSRMEGVQERLENKDITNQQLMRMSKEILDLQFDVTKSKLANVLDCSQEDIKLYTYGRDVDGKQQETVEVYENGFRKDVYSNNLKKSNIMPVQVAEMIRNIPDMQGVIGQLQNGDVNRKEIIGKCKQAFDETSKFAAMELKYDEQNKSILVGVTKVSELNKKSDKALKEEEGDLYKGSSETYKISQTQKDDDGR